MLSVDLSAVFWKIFDLEETDQDRSPPEHEFHWIARIWKFSKVSDQLPTFVLPLGKATDSKRLEEVRYCINIVFKIGSRIRGRKSFDLVPELREK